MTLPEDRQAKPRKARSGTNGPKVADVARAAGVSPMTVSRVINLEPNVSAATRERVQAAIAMLGYVPNPAARTLAGGQQCRIALLHSNPSAAYLSEFLMGSLVQAGATDAQLIVEHCDPHLSPETLVQRLAGHRVDAVLLPPPLCDDAGMLDAIHRAGLAMAQIATGRPSPLAYALTIDDAEAAYAMTTHLIGLGHRRIGFISGDANQTASAMRLGGYQRAIGDAGLSFDPGLVAPGDFTYRSGLAATEALLARTPRPTAIFASNDDMAAGAMAAAHRHHLEVPRDLSVCGFDDTATALMIWPELTTIHQPIADMARQATAILVEAVRARATSRPRPVRHVRLNFTLRRRASDGPPPRNA